MGQHDTGSLARRKPGPGSWGRTSGLSIIDRVLNRAELFPDGAPCRRHRAMLRCAGGFKKCVELAFSDYRSGASQPMLTGRVILEPMERIERSSVAYRATALPLSYIGWSQRGYSKPRPPRYECGALPLELLRHGASAENRPPLIGLAIRRPTNMPHPQKDFGADGDNRN